MSIADPTKAAIFHKSIVRGVPVASFIAAMSGLAQLSGNALLLFPELGALSFDVFEKPNGAWAKSPLMLIATPFLTGLVGTLATRCLAYGLLSVIITVASAILIIRALNSPIAPAISAGLLPLTLDQASWWYAPSLLAGSSVLAGISVIRRSGQPTQVLADASSAIGLPPNGDVVRELTWIPFFCIFLVITTCAAILTGMRFLLFPPLMVIAYEMFAHSETCPWAQRPLLLPVINCLTATAATLLLAWLGSGFLVPALAVLAAATLTGMFAIYFPPAMAIAILPFVMSQTDYRYPVAVAIGSSLLSLTFLVWQGFRHRTT